MSDPKKLWEVTIEADPDDPESVILPLPEELLAECGWKPGDEIGISVKEDGSIHFTLVTKSENEPVA